MVRPGPSSGPASRRRVAKEACRRSAELRKLQLSLCRRGMLGAVAWRRATAGAGRWKADAQTLRLNLKELLGVWKTGEAMSTKAPESETACRGFPSGPSGGGRHDDLSPRRRAADAGRGMDGEADVPDIRQCRVAAVNPDTHPHFQIVGPV